MIRLLKRSATDVLIGVVAFTCLLSLEAAIAAPLGSNGEPMPAEMQTPIMRQASAAFHRGDAKTAVALIRQAARSGNSIAQVTLGKLYADGRGVPQDYVQSIKILAGVVKLQKQPSLALATEALEDITKSLQNSPNPSDRQLAALAGALPLAADPRIQQMGRAVQYSLEHSHVEICSGMFCF